MPLRRRIDARAIDEVECVASVMLAVWAAHRIGAQNVSWAAFAGYMVMRGHAADTLVRGALRIVGTIAGGALALALAPLTRSAGALAVAALFLVSTTTLYAALVGRRAYAWLFLGLTFAMATLDRLRFPGGATDTFVATRVVETLTGTLVCVAVSVLSTATLRRRWPAVRAAIPVGRRWHPDAARHALQGGLALGALSVTALLFRVPSSAQGAVTIMAAMLIPVANVGAGGHGHVNHRILHRMAGCIAGATFALPFLLTARGSMPLLLAGTALGVALGRHVENGAHAYRYVGTQFTLAVLVTLVPDNAAAGSIDPGFERLVGILIGASILSIVLLAWHLVAPGARRKAPRMVRGVDEPGGI